MSTAPLQQAIAATRGVLANVSADQLQNQSPCASWDVAGVINHVVGAQHFFVAGMKGQPPSGDDTNWAEGDFLAAFDDAAAATVACFDPILHNPIPNKNYSRAYQNHQHKRLKTHQDIIWQPVIIKSDQ